MPTDYEQDNKLFSIEEICFHHIFTQEGRTQKAGNNEDRKEQFQFIKTTNRSWAILGLFPKSKHRWMYLTEAQVFGQWITKWDSRPQICPHSVDCQKSVKESAKGISYNQNFIYWWYYYFDFQLFADTERSHEH